MLAGAVTRELIGGQPTACSVASSVIAGHGGFHTRLGHGVPWLPVALFALPAGVGDIAVGIATPWITRKLADGSGGRAAVWFNLLGIVDLSDAQILGGLTGFHVVSVSPSASLNSQLPLAA